MFRLFVSVLSLGVIKMGVCMQHLDAPVGQAWVVLCALLLLECRHFIPPRAVALTSLEETVAGTDDCGHDHRSDHAVDTSAHSLQSSDHHDHEKNHDSSYLCLESANDTSQGFYS